MRPILTTLLLLCCLLIPTAPMVSAEPAPPPSGGPQQQDPCPCPCDQQQINNFLLQQVNNLANELGRFTEAPAKKLAQALRGIGNDLRKGKLTFEQAVQELHKLRGEIEKEIKRLEDQIKEIEADRKMTPRAKENRIKQLREELDRYARLLNGVRDNKGNVVLYGYDQLLQCLQKCLDAQKEAEKGR